MAQMARRAAPVGRWSRLILYAVVFLLIFRLNQMTDYTSDDFSYHFFYASRVPTDDTRLLTGPFDVLGSVASHYMVQNGRILSHALLQWVCLFDKGVFDIVNTIAFLVTGRLVARHIVGRRPIPVALEALAFVSLFLFIPYFGQSVLWMSGAANYLWMAAVTLATLLPYRLHERTSGHQMWLVPAMLVLGLIGGSTNENSAGAWILMALLFMVTWLRTGVGVPLWAGAGVVGACIGLYVQLASPGNHIRAERLGGTTDLATILANGPYILKIAAETSGLLLAVTVVAALLRRRRMGRWDAATTLAMCYALAGLASGFIMVVTPTMPHRSWVWTVLFLLIGIGGLLLEPLPSRRQSTRLRIALAALAGIAIVVYVQAYGSIHQTHQEVAAELRTVAEAKERGINDVVVTKFRQPSNTYNALAFTPNLRAEPDAVVNRWFARFYGINSVTVDNPEEVYR